MYWEQIDGMHQRAKVFGGWLVKAYENVLVNDGNGLQSGWAWQVSMAFVPDASHEWKLENK